MSASALMDTKKMIMVSVLIAKQILAKEYFPVNIKMHLMVCGRMVNNVMMEIIIREMVVIIFK